MTARQKPPTENHLPTWAFAIPTYNRQAVLLQAVEHALAQTHPPIEVIISDSSPDRSETEVKLKALIQENAPSVRLVCVAAKIPRQSAQRNEVIAEATADLLFLFDDDTFLSPDGAERLCRYFVADAEHKLVGLCPGDLRRDEAVSFFEVPDGVRGGSAAGNFSGNAFLRWWLNLFPGTLQAAHPTPKEFEGLGSVFFVEGYKIVTRREVAQKHLFDPKIVINYGEEADFCYRITREGAIVEIPDRVVFHMAAPRVGGASREGPLYRYACHLISAYRVRKYFGDGLYYRVYPLWSWLRYLLWDAFGILRGKGIARFRGSFRALPMLIQFAIKPAKTLGALTESALEKAKQWKKG